MISRYSSNWRKSSKFGAFGLKFGGIPRNQGIYSRYTKKTVSCGKSIKERSKLKKK